MQLIPFRTLLRRQASENFRDRRGTLRSSCACASAQEVRRVRKKADVRALIYKIVCFPVIAKVARARNFFSL